MKKAHIWFLFLSASLFLIWSSLLSKKSKADIVFPTPTAAPAYGGAKVTSLCIDFRTKQFTIYYATTDGTGNVLNSLGNVQVPFPNPTPALLATIQNAAEKSIAGYSSGSIGPVPTPPFPSSTVVSPF